jgi:glycosyltransferase involved in cell wall biosynthesis
MHLAIVNHYALPPGASGGPTRHLGIAKALVAEGHEVVIHASVYDHYTRRDHRERSSSREVIEVIEGVTYVWWSTPAYGSTALRVRNMASFAASVGMRGAHLDLPRPDVVIGSSPHLLAGPAARRLARAHGVPFVFEVRDLWPQTFVDMGELGRWNPLTLALRQIECSMYRSADRVITALPASIDYLVAHGAAREKVVHIPNGVELAGSDPTPRVRPGGAPFTIVYAGTIGHANNLEVAVTAADELRARGRNDIVIRLVGAGPERGRIARMIEQRPGAGIRLDPAVPSNEVPTVLAEADACLLVLRPSPVFGWGVSPTKLFDYLAAARPVVAAVSAPDTIVGPAGAGLWVEAGQPARLADAIEELADAPVEELAAMGKRGRHYVEQQHGFSSLAQELLTVLEGCLAGTP